MRVQLALTFLLLSNLSLANDDKSVQELFKKYDQVMIDKKTELVDEVFTQKFLHGSGGKESFIAKVKELPKDNEKTKLTWTKGVKNQMIFAKLRPVTKKKGHEDSGEFVIVRENGKLKIDGTASDAD